jgi:putative membrane protein
LDGTQAPGKLAQRPENAPITRGPAMNYANSSTWFFGWEWIVWVAFLFLMVSSVGNWGYAYRAHRRVDGLPGKAALAIINERYARGELTREQYLLLKSDIASG